MSEDGHSTGIVDAITQFAMRQSSRRGFMKWVAKAGLAMAAAAGGGLAFVSTAFAGYDCSKYLPGCHGPCVCVSCCTDPDDGRPCCYGCCDYCGPEQLVEVRRYYAWNGSTCVANTICIDCG